MMQPIAAFSLILLMFISSQTMAACPDWLNHDMQKLRSKDSVNLCSIGEGKTLLIVNTASSCGFTPQFKALENLNQRYKDKGLVIIGFPSDSFWQEHDDSEKTAEVCYVNYGVTFLMLESSAVRGGDANPVFKALNESLGKPSWNFNKYLVDKSGKPLQRFGSRTEPDAPELIKAIDAALAL
jgi:glutathione peroxidase